jgi:hypothetical protein
MKLALIYIITVGTFLALSCNNAGTTSTALTKPGTVVAHDEMSFKEDTLNHYKFSITVTADSDVEKGVYDISATVGHNSGASKFTMPKGGEDLVPLLRRGSKPDTYMIGFKAGKDTAFNEYFLVSGEKGGIKMMYVKSYSFQ